MEKFYHCISITYIDSIYRNEFDQRFGITTAFLATHSGLTRWMDFQKPNNNYVGDSQPEYVSYKTFHLLLMSNLDASRVKLFKLNDKCTFNCREPSVSILRSVDEVWYKRAVEQHYVEPQSFVYSVPFNQGLYNQIYILKLEYSDNWIGVIFTDDSPIDVNNILVTASHAIFHSEDKKSAPSAVVGYQFQHSALQALFKNITTNVSAEKYFDRIWCQFSSSLTAFEHKIQLNYLKLMTLIRTNDFCFSFSAVKIVQKPVSQEIQILNASY